jgi:hypothetical protein
MTNIRRSSWWKQQTHRNDYRQLSAMSTVFSRTGAQKSHSNAVASPRVICKYGAEIVVSVRVWQKPTGLLENGVEGLVE